MSIIKSISKLFSSKGHSKPVSKITTSKNELESVGHNINEITNDLHIVQIENPVIKFSQNPPDNFEEYFSIWSGETYLVNLGQLICSCPDFTKRRFNFEKTDPRRICKHLLDRFKTEDYFNNQDDLIKEVLESGRVDTEFYTLQINNNTRIAFIYGNTEWVNVYCRNRKPNDKYGIYTGKFNEYGLTRSGKYWSYGKAPPGSKMIKYILSHTGVI